MPDVTVANEELAKSKPEKPIDAYDSKHGSHKETPPAVEDTAVNATRIVEPSSPWRNLKSG